MKKKTFAASRLWLLLFLLLSLFLSSHHHHNHGVPRLFFLPAACAEEEEEEETQTTTTSTTGSELVCKNCNDDDEIRKTNEQQQQQQQKQRLLLSSNFRAHWWFRFWRRQWFPKLLPGEAFRLSLTASAAPSPAVAAEEPSSDLLSGEEFQKRKARSSSSIEVREREDEASCLEWSVCPNHVNNYDEEDSVTGSDPHAGMVLTLTGGSYELVEPVQLELGAAAIPRYLTDHAYKPFDSFVSGDDDDSEDQQLQDSDTRVAEAGDNKLLEESTNFNPNAWWQWWIPRWAWNNPNDDHFSSYRMNSKAFAGGSHGEVWRGRRWCTAKQRRQTPALCQESLIFKRLRVEKGYRILQAGLREVHFGRWLTQQAGMFTRYIDHFFREQSGGDLDLWIVFADAGPSLRSYLYTGIVVRDLVIFQQSTLWTEMRFSFHRFFNSSSSSPDGSLEAKALNQFSSHANDEELGSGRTNASPGKEFVRTVLRQILESAAFLHSGGVVHRDIKPPNVMCKHDFQPERSLDGGPSSFGNGDFSSIHCVLGDFSSAWSELAQRHLYTTGPSRMEQTDEYAPPEATFGFMYNQSKPLISPAFDSWSIGVLALELLLGSPNVFTVDQRTRAVLSHKMMKEGASQNELQRALYLAALSQFCIYNPTQDWPLRDGDPLHPYRHSIVKTTCTLNDFHRALRARDPLGLGFDSSADLLLQLIWQLLEWDPTKRITAADALSHPYFTQETDVQDMSSNDHTALESQMLDPRMDFNLSDSVDEFHCTKCSRSFSDWNSCLQHTTSRNHGRFCTYDRSALPTCLNAHSMLPAHPFSGYCDIQGRRPTIEDFHAIHLLSSLQFYGIFDGHTGNLASKFVASSLYEKLEPRLSRILLAEDLAFDWKLQVESAVTEAFNELHLDFLEVTSRVPHVFMDQSGTTATSVFVTSSAVVIASLGDSRAVLSSFRGENGELTAIQLTTDHVASDPLERTLVENRGGNVVKQNGVYRVNGELAITRSIGDAALSPYLSRDPHVVSLSKREIMSSCGQYYNQKLPCFLVVASDGLWDTVSNQEAVDLVAEVVSSASRNVSSWSESAGLQQAAEALTLESYVRGSKDNIGVVIIAITQDDNPL